MVVALLTDADLRGLTQPRADPGRCTSPQRAGSSLSSPRRAMRRFGEAALAGNPSSFFWLERQCRIATVINGEAGAQGGVCVATETIKVL